MTIADDRSTGVPCPGCDKSLRAGEDITVCAACGTPHHKECWDRASACSAYECAPASRANGPTRAPGAGLVITTAQLAVAVPLPSRPSFQGDQSAIPGQLGAGIRPKLSRGALAAAICAVGGIPFFGIVTGAVAVVLASISFGPIRSGLRRGVWLASFAILLGLVDVVGWAILLSHVLSGGSGVVGFNTADFRVSESDLRAAPPVVAAALRANVLISRGGVMSLSIGSGVVLSVHDGSALILTNRHVASPDRSTEGEEVTVQFVDGRTCTGKVAWVGPDGVDAALIRAPASSGAGAASFDPTMSPHIGDDVFAVGNPRGLGWTHTKGAVSQFRERSTGGPIPLRVIQTSAPINPGNSGGGLYDAAGHLVGINTWAGDKRDSEGLGFAISLDSLCAILPKWAIDHDARGGEPR